MKPQRLLKLPIVFLIPLALLSVLVATADLAGPATTLDHNPADSLPGAASDNPSLTAMRAFSIPYMANNSFLSSSAGSQIIAMRAISIPYTVNNSALLPSAGSQIVAMRAISIPYTIGNMGG